MTPDIKSRIDALTPDAGLQHIPAKAGQAEEFHPLVRRSDMHAAIEAVTGSEMSHTNPLPELPRPFVPGDEFNPRNYYTADQMREYATAAYDLGARSTAAQPATLPEPVLQALRFYANGDHYITDDAENFDTVSGEPENWLCSGREDSGTMIETGLIARSALKGEALNWIDGGEDEQPLPVAGEVFGPAAAQPVEPMVSYSHVTGGARFRQRACDQLPPWAYDVRLEPPAASGDSTPPSAPVQGDPSGALRPEPEAVGQGSLSPNDVAYPRDLFDELIHRGSPYAFYLFQWVPYQTDAQRWRLKMLHDVRTFDGREALGIWPNGSHCGPFRDDEVEFIRISRKQHCGEWIDPRKVPEPPQASGERGD